MRDSEVLLSVIVPVFNEQEGIEHFHNDLLLPSLQKAVKNSYEVIYVNDGSSDKSLDVLERFAKSKKVKIVNLSRNFGKEIALTAGLGAAQGKATLFMDADGQYPPDRISDFLKEWKNGAQVVVGIRNSNQEEGAIKKWGSKVFYKLFNSFSGAEIVPRSTDYRLIDAAVRDAFLRCTERQRITRGLIDWLGFHRVYITFDSPARIAGEASYSTRKLAKLAVHSFVSLSLAPLFFFGWLGFAIVLLSLLVGIFIIIEQILLGDPLGLNFTGSAMLGIFISFLVGLVLTSQGVIAIYLSHVHTQTQNRPLFVIDRSRSRNLKDD